jgi:DNA-binding transcriptional MerR regulator
MYNLHNAARVLGVSRQTVRKWIAEDNIEIKMIATDRNRIYLAYTDIIALANKHRPLRLHGLEENKKFQELEGLYSLEEASKILGVKNQTVRVWVSESKIERKILTTDKRRAYISYSSLVALSEKYNHPIAYDKLKKAKVSENQENSDSDDNKLYTVADAALFLGVTEDTVRDWLSKHNIERQSKGNDGRRIYISYSAQLPQRLLNNTPSTGPKSASRAT